VGFTYPKPQIHQFDKRRAGVATSPNSGFAGGLSLLGRASPAHVRYRHEPEGLTCGTAAGFTDAARPAHPARAPRRPPGRPRSVRRSRRRLGRRSPEDESEEYPCSTLRRVPGRPHGRRWRIRAPHRLLPIGAAVASAQARPRSRRPAAQAEEALRHLIAFPQRDCRSRRLEGGATWLPPRRRTYGCVVKLQISVSPKPTGQSSTGFGASASAAPSCRSIRHSLIAGQTVALRASFHTVTP
jgi:hypothetical protein